MATRVEQPVVCRPTDKQRRYCKCIGSTCCGASLAAFLRDTTYERHWLFTRSIARSGGSILSYRVRLPRRRETIVVTVRRVVPGPLFLFSLFRFPRIQRPFFSRSLVPPSFSSLPFSPPPPPPTARHPSVRPSVRPSPSSPDPRERM